MAEEAVGKVGLDTTDFKTGISTMNREIRVLESGFKAVAAGMDDWKSSSDGLEARQKALTQIIDVQKNKVAALEAEHKRVAAAEGENSKAAQDLEIRLNKEQAALNASQKELTDNARSLEKMGDEAKEAGNDLNAYAKDVQNSDNKTSKFGDTVKRVGSAIGGGIATGARVLASGLIAVGTAAIAGVKGLLDATKAAADLTDKLAEMSKESGVSIDTLQKWSYASPLVDVELETMTGSMTKLEKSMGAAQEGSKKQIAAFKELGASATDANGNLRDSEEVFYDAIDALGGVKNETERDVLAMTLFGKSAKELNPLIAVGSEELKRLGKEAQDLGLVMGGEAVNQLNKFKDTTDRLKAQAGGMKNALAMIALPAFQGFADGVSSIMAKVQGVLADGFQSGDIDQIGVIIGDALAGATETVVSAMPNFISTVSSILSKVASALIEAIPQVLPALADGALQMIQALLESLQANAPPLAAMGVTLITQLVQMMVTSLPLLIDIGLQIIMQLLQGITAQLPTLIPAAVEMILTIVQTLLDNLPQLITVAIDLILALIDGILNALPKIIESAPKIIESLIKGIVSAIPKLVDMAIKVITAMVDYFTNNLPMVIQMAIEILLAIITGLIQAIPELIAAMPKIIMAIIDTIIKTDWLKVGKDILLGIAKGVVNGVGALVDAVKDAAQRALQAAKNLLGIHSPSTVFADQVGKNVSLGIAKGVVDNVSAVTSAMKTVTSDMQVASASSGSSGSTTMQSETNIKITVDVTGAVDKETAQSLGNAVGDRVALNLRWRGVSLNNG